MVIHCRLVLSFIALLISEVSLVAETLVFKFLTEFSFHKLVSDTNSIRNVCSTSHAAKRMFASKCDLGARFSNIRHFVMIVKTGLFRSSSLIEERFKITS